MVQCWGRFWDLQALLLCTCSRAEHACICANGPDLCTGASASSCRPCFCRLILLFICVRARFGVHGWPGVLRLSCSCARACGQQQCNSASSWLGSIADGYRTATAVQGCGAKWHAGYARQPTSVRLLCPAIQACAEVQAASAFKQSRAAVCASASGSVCAAAAAASADCTVRFAQLWIVAYLSLGLWRCATQARRAVHAAQSASVAGSQASSSAAAPAVLILACAAEYAWHWVRAVCCIAA